MSNRTLARGGKQILVDDPSGNPVELFEAAWAERNQVDPADQMIWSGDRRGSP